MMISLNTLTSYDFRKHSNSTMTWFKNRISVKEEEIEEEIDVVATFGDCSMRMHKTVSDKQTQSEAVSTSLSLNLI